MNSDNNLFLRKPIILALISIGISIAINIIFGLFGNKQLFFIGISSGLIIGGIYANKFKEIMPRKIRIKTSIYYVIISNFVILFIFYVFFNFPIIFYIIFSLILALIVVSFYWFLGEGGKIQMDIIKIQMRQSQIEQETNKKLYGSIFFKIARLAIFFAITIFALRIILFILCL